MKARIALLFLLISVTFAAAAEVVLFDGKRPVTINFPQWSRRPVPEVAARMLADDLEAVTGSTPVTTSRDEATIKIYNLATATPEEQAELRRVKINPDEIRSAKDAFTLRSHKGHLYVVGADDRGTAYGMLEVSRLAGVSPWIWWGDSRPERKDRITVPDNYSTTQTPSVEFRGVFINDEDWSLRPWSCLTFEPGNPYGMIGSRTYGELFRLLLRLRANMIWPAMHPGTTPFFMVPGAKEVADSCGIAIGTSHCEPLLRNNVGEWDESDRGPYNYITNSDAVREYWIERLAETGANENIYTLGMRGIHDGNMEGVKTMNEKVTALQRIIDDQRVLLATHVDKDVESIPQVFVPYKEVLEIMENGLEVPDDVTLIWCDDNYGYLTRLSDSIQARRSGGAGIYYHLSYWGRPHDYLWLCGTQPGLIVSEMNTAFSHGARKLWIANIHDPRTAAYDLELFLDMAWDIGSVTPATTSNHLESWLCREFGDIAGRELLPVMMEYYRLCGVRRPEHLGWSQVELSNRKIYPRGRSQVTDTEFTLGAQDCDGEIYLDRYRHLASRVGEIEPSIPAEKRDMYFTVIKYPVVCAASMAEKMLEAQRARSYAMGQDNRTIFTRDSIMLGACARAAEAYQRIRSLTRFHNDTLAAGKWRHLMSCAPRDLYAFNPPTLPVGLTDDEIALYRDCRPQPTGQKRGSDATIINACDYSAATSPQKSASMLGHSMKAVSLPKGESVSYQFPVSNEGPKTILVALVPTHPLDTGDIRIGVSIDGDDARIISYREKGRTDRWRENVMRNQVRIPVSATLAPGEHSVTVTAVDSHVILDQLYIAPASEKVSYFFATNSE